MDDMGKGVYQHEGTYFAFVRKSSRSCTSFGCCSEVPLALSVA